MQVLGRQHNAFNKHTAKPAMQISGGVIAALVRDNYPRSLLPHYDEKINGGLILGCATINACAKRRRQRCMFAIVCSSVDIWILLRLNSYPPAQSPRLCRCAVLLEINLAFMAL